MGIHLSDWVENIVRKGEFYSDAKFYWLNHAYNMISGVSQQQFTLLMFMTSESRLLHFTRKPLKVLF